MIEEAQNALDFGACICHNNDALYRHNLQPIRRTSFGLSVRIQQQSLVCVVAMVGGVTTNGIVRVRLHGQQICNHVTKYV